MYLSLLISWIPLDEGQTPGAWRFSALCNSPALGGPSIAMQPVARPRREDGQIGGLQQQFAIQPGSRRATVQTCRSCGYCTCMLSTRGGRMVQDGAHSAGANNYDASYRGLQ